MADRPPIGRCVPEFQPPSRSRGRRLLVFVIFIVLLADAVLVVCGLDLRIAVTGAAAGLLVAAEVANRVLGSGADSRAVVALVLATLLFALLLSARGTEPALALAYAAAAVTVAGEVAARVIATPAAE
jgi:hypothetical protein